MTPEIITLPNPILRERAKEISAEFMASSGMKTLVQRLTETLRGSADGVGIAAPQIGESLRVFLVSEESRAIDRGEAHDPKRVWKYFVYANPVITNFSRKKNDDAEGCLSVPGKYGIVPRPEKIEIEAYDENGRKFSHGATRFFARVLQHEVDHLDGILFIDRVSRFVEVGESDAKL